MKKILKTEGANGLLLVSPTFIYAFLLLAVPIAAVVTFSFWTQNYLDLDTTFTLDNYRAAAQEPIYRVLLFRSLNSIDKLLRWVFVYKIISSYIQTKFRIWRLKI